MKYARFERERRFLLHHCPVDVSDSRRITDLYRLDLRMRLRKVEHANHVKYKLGQKFTVSASQPTHRQMTTMYLTKSEYETLLLELGPKGLLWGKTRLTWNRPDQNSWCIDCLDDGRFIAEVETKTDEELALIAVPQMAIREITGELETEGHKLAKHFAAN